jgi:glutamate--cysteine ligase
MICGVHLNVSIGDALAAEIIRTHPPAPAGIETRQRDALYLRLARNLYRDLPHLILLTGASPILGGLCGDGYGTAVSYRNSALGYAGSEFRPYLDLTSLEAYTAGIRKGLDTESERFAALEAGRRGVQLNTRVFQTEKEFYAPVRLKRRARPGEMGLDALSRDGIEYVELRFLDVDPFSPLGVSEDTLRLMHMFILDGLMRASGAGSPEELGGSLEEAEAAALAGSAHADRLAEARRRLDSLEPIALELDRAGGGDYRAVLDGAVGKTAYPARLPSARLLAAIGSAGGDWTRLGLDVAVSRRNAA